MARLCLALTVLSAGAGFSALPASRAAAPSAEQYPAVVGNVDQFLTRLSGFGFSGVVLIARHDDIVLKKGYGLANEQGAIPHAPDTVFDVGSLTKMFTAAAVLQLEAAGRLRTSDPLGEHLDGVPPDKKAITIAQLLAHTSGMDRDFPLKDPKGPYYEEVARDDAVRRILQKPLIDRPGKTWAYSNIGYVLLAAIVERTAGVPYRDYLREHLFRPAGMACAGFWGSGLPTVPDARLARSYDETGENGNLAKLSGTTWLDLGAGEMVATVGDLYQWWRALKGTAVLSEAAKQKMFTPNLSNYGFGCWIQKTPRGTKLIQHGGDYLGYGSQFSWFVDEDTLVVTLANRSNQDFGVRHVADRLVPQILFGQGTYHMYAGDEFEMPPDSTDLGSELATKAVGTYQLDSGGQLIIRAKGKEFEIGAAGEDAVDLLTAANEKERQHRAALSKHAEEVLLGLLHEDTAALARYLRPGGPLKTYANALGGALRDAQKEKGAFRSLENVGAAPGAYPVGVITTIMRVRCERGDEYLQLGWFKDHIVFFGAPPKLAAVTPLRARGPSTLVAWSIIWFKGFEATLTATGPNRADLEIKQNGRTIIARRVP